MDDIKFTEDERRVIRLLAVSAADEFTDWTSNPPHGETFPKDDPLIEGDVPTMLSVYRKVGGRFLVFGPTATMTADESAAYGDSQERPRWDEDLPVGRTQSETEAFAEACIDAAMAQAHVAALDRDEDE